MISSYFLFFFEIDNWNKYVDKDGPPAEDMTSHGMLYPYKLMLDAQAGMTVAVETIPDFPTATVRGSSSMLPYVVTT